MSDRIFALCVPKWGLSMKEGRIGDWLVTLGQPVKEGDELLEIETDKITNVLEAPASGILRRQIGQTGETLKVGRLVGVLAGADVTDAAIDLFVTDYAQQADDDAQADDREQDVPMQVAMLGDRAIHYSRTGNADGETIVLIHGFAGDANGWMMTGVALAQDHDVVMFDLPGHGGSTKSVGNGALAGLADDLDGLLGAIDVSRAHFVGHSMGAAVSLEFARDHPDCVKSLTLIAPIGLPGTRVSTDFLQGVVAATRQRDMRQWLEMLVADPRLISKAMVDDVIKAKRRDGAQDALKAFADRLGAGDDLRALEQNLPQGVPTLVIVADGDRIAGRPDAARLPSGYHIEPIADAGHMPHVEASSTANSLILAHIARTAAGPV